MKKVISLFTALIIFVSALGIQGFSAFAEDSFIYTGLQENPFYAGREIAGGSVEEVVLHESVSRTYNNKTYYSAGSEIYNKILSAMQKRTDEITFYYLSKTRLSTVTRITSAIDSLVASATDDSFNSSCTGGDYQRWSFQTWAASVSETYNKSPYYYYKVTLELYYYDTAAEEKQVNTVVNSFVNGIDTNSMTDYEILKAVHDFICSNTTYDYDAVDSYKSHLYAFSAYGALVKGRCVCQGYSLAFYRLCKELGYSTRIITSDYYIPLTFSRQGHAWNLVGLNGKYYFVDTTWDDSEDKENYKYFLVNYKNIRYDDTLDEHYPEEKYYDGEYYITNYADKVDENNYDSTNSSLLSNCVVSLSADSFVYSGDSNAPAVTVRNGSGTELTEGEYSVLYKGGTNTGLATVNVTGAGEFEGSSSHRQFYVVPAKANKLSLASGGRAATSLTLKWNASSGDVTGYKIEHYSGGKWSVVATATGTTATVTSLAPATAHKFRIRAYKTVSKRNYYGAYSTVFTSCTKPKTPSFTLKTSKKTITLSRKKVAASGYEIQRSTSKSFSNKTTTTYIVPNNNTASRKFTGLKKGKVYYFRIRAYKTYNCKRYYSAWTKTKSIKCK